MSLHVLLPEEAHVAHPFATQKNASFFTPFVLCFSTPLATPLICKQDAM